MAAAQAVLAAGGKVAWVDFDDSDWGLAQRWVTLLGRDEAIAAARGDLLLFRGERSPALHWAQQVAQHVGSEGLVVIDSAEKSGAPSDGSMIDDWWEVQIAPFEFSCGVVIVDHTTKNTPEGGRPKGPIGSQAKFARIRGLGWFAEAVDGEHWTKEKGGQISMKCEKDNSGHVAAGTVLHVSAAYKGDDDARTLDIAFTRPDGDGVIEFVQAWAKQDPDSSWNATLLINDLMPRLGVKGTKTKRLAIRAAAVGVQRKSD